MTGKHVPDMPTVAAGDVPCPLDTTASEAAIIAAAHSMGALRIAGAFDIPEFYVLHNRPFTHGKP